MEQTWKDLLLVIVLHLECCPILARSNWTQLKDEWYYSEFKQSNQLFEIECEKWRTWICPDVSKNMVNARTKAFHHNHRVTLTVVSHTWKDHSLYPSFGCKVFGHEIHILWATSHLEGIKGFMDGTLRTKETRHVHQTSLKLHSDVSSEWMLDWTLCGFHYAYYYDNFDRNNSEYNNNSIRPAGSWYWMDVKNWEQQSYLHLQIKPYYDTYCCNFLSDIYYYQ